MSLYAVNELNSSGFGGNLEVLPGNITDLDTWEVTWFDYSVETDGDVDQYPVLLTQLMNEQVKAEFLKIITTDNQVNNPLVMQEKQVGGAITETSIQPGSFISDRNLNNTVDIDLQGEYFILKMGNILQYTVEGNTKVELYFCFNRDATAKFTFEHEPEDAIEIEPGIDFTIKSEEKKIIKRNCWWLWVLLAIEIWIIYKERKKG